MYYGTDASKGMQFGSKNQKPEILTFTTSDIKGTITKVTVNSSGSNTPNAKIGVKVGETEFSCTGSSTSITSTATNFIFTGSASGDVSINWTGNTKGGIYVKSITIEYTTGGTVIPSKDEHGLAWSEESYTYNLGEALNAPTLSNPNGLDVTYSSSDETVATIDAAGNLSVLGTGKTTITATTEGNDSYEAGEVSYELSVVDPTTPKDEITATALGLSGSYADFNNVSFPTGAVYSGCAMTQSGYIQINTSKKTNYHGIYAVQSAGLVKSVNLKFNKSSKNVYVLASNDPFDPTENYSTTNAVATLSESNTSYTFVDDYRYIALKASGAVYLDEVIIEWAEDMPQVATPTYEFVNYLNFDYADINLACETEGVTYKYTINGGEEQSTASQIRLNEYGTYELTFWAEKEGMRASKKTTETIVYKDPFEMAFSLEPGEYPYGTELTVSVESADVAKFAKFGYKITYADSSVTTKNDVDYEDLKFTLTADCTIAVNVSYGDVYKELTGSFTVSAPDAPAFSKNGGLVLAGTEIALSAADGLPIYYTTDGTEPTNASVLYTAPVVVVDDMTIRAVAYAGSVKSAVAEATFDVQNSLAEINALANGAEVLYSGELTVVFASGSNVYVYDGTDYSLLYQSNLGLEANDVIKAGWAGKVAFYNGLFEISTITGIEKDADATPLNAVPTEVRRNDYDQIVTHDNMHAYVEIKNIKIDGLSGKNFTSAFGTIYNQLNCEDYTAKGHYDIVGFVGYYEKGTTKTVQIFPTEMTLLDNPMIKVYWHNHNGTVSIGWSAPHVHYSLDDRETFETPVKMTPSAAPVSIQAYAAAANEINNDWEAEIPAKATHVFFTNNGDESKKTETSEAVDGKHYAASNDDVTGIENIAIENGVPAEYFNLQGVRVENPTEGGIYIMRQGTKTSKVRITNN